MTFKEQVWEVVRAIPEGQTLSYKEVAIRAGKPHAARVVGMIMARTDDSTVPCHRVIRSDGRVGGFGGFPGQKEAMLAREGARK